MQSPARLRHGRGHAKRMPEDDPMHIARSTSHKKREGFGAVRRVEDQAVLDGAAAGGLARSEEHTSELQSRLHLVCRLLLEKKKIQTLPQCDLVLVIRTEQLRCLKN